MLLLQLYLSAPAPQQAGADRASAAGDRDYTEQLHNLRRIASEEPARVAVVLDHWLDDASGSASFSPWTHAEQAAAVLMALESPVAATVLREFSPERIQALMGQMGAMASPDAAQLKRILLRFNEDVFDVSLVRPSQVEDLRGLLDEALGEERAGLLKASFSVQGQSAQLAKLKWLSGATIADMIAREHPQIQALLIACLAPVQAAAVLQDFDLERRRELLARLGGLQNVSSAALAELDWLIEEYLNDRGHSGRRVAGESLAAAVLNEMDVATESALLEGLRERQPAMVSRIEEQMFGFEQLERLSPADLHLIVAQLNPQLVLRAAQGAPLALRRALQGALGEGYGDLATTEKASPADIELARQELLAVTKRLAAVGEIVLDKRRLAGG